MNSEKYRFFCDRHFARKNIGLQILVAQVFQKVHEIRELNWDLFCFEIPTSTVFSFKSRLCFACEFIGDVIKNSFLVQKPRAAVTFPKDQAYRDKIPISDQKTGRSEKTSFLYSGRQETILRHHGDLAYIISRGWRSVSGWMSDCVLCFILC